MAKCCLGYSRRVRGNNVGKKTRLGVIEGLGARRLAGLWREWGR